MGFFCQILEEVEIENCCPVAAFALFGQGSVPVRSAAIMKVLCIFMMKWKFSMFLQMKFLSKVLVLALCVSVVGCASNQSAAVYQRNQVGRVQTVEFGTVIDVKPVTISGTETGIGSIGGAAIGGIAAGAIGEGRGSEVASIVGGIAGLVAGTKAEEAATRRSALEITIEKSDGSIISVVQPDDVPIATGSRVKLLTQPNGSIRVSQ